MALCRLADLFYDRLPWPPIRALLIRVHMGDCPLCRARLADREDVRTLLVPGEAVAGTETLWRRIAAEASTWRPKERTVPDDRRRGPIVRRWAPAALLVLVVASTGLWLMRQVERSQERSVASGSRASFAIDYVRIGGAPARAFIYKPQGSETVFIWAERMP